MIRQQMFAEEQRIRSVLGGFRGAVLSEQERYGAYGRKNAAKSGLLADWRGRICVYTEAFNLLSDYLTDYTLGLHGVLKHVSQAEQERDTAKTTLLYLDRLHAKRAERMAVEKAEQIAYGIMGDLVDQMEPQLRKAWSEAVLGEMTLYEQMVQERRNGHA